MGRGIANEIELIEEAVTAGARRFRACPCTSTILFLTTEAYLPRLLCYVVDLLCGRFIINIVLVHLMTIANHKVYSGQSLSSSEKLVFQKALILDRDGVINNDIGYVGSIERFYWCDDIIPFIKRFSSDGYRVFVVTNQSGIARGYFSEKKFLDVMDWMVGELENHEITVDAVFWCPHHPELTGICECRKPSHKMLTDLALKFQIDLNASVFVGDKDTDMLAGLSGGVGSLFQICSEGELGSETNAWQQVTSLMEIR